MPRDGAHARDRLVAAALELYSEHGYDQTTAADIADTIWWIANLPPHLNINRIELMPTSQSFAGFNVHRS